MTVGKGAEAEIVAMEAGEHDIRLPAAACMKLELKPPSLLLVEPERSIHAAADVVDAMAVAAGGSG